MNYGKRRKRKEIRSCHDDQGKLLGMALGMLQLSSDGKIAWMSVTKEMHERTGTGSADTENFIDYIRSLKDVEIAIFFRETEDESVKVSMRSKGKLAVDQIAAMFGGGGHRAAAGCNISGRLDKVIDVIVETVRSKM